ncbi:MAG: hypothetical protein ABR598_03035 [Candidatus Dormibacteria bacterium]
MKMRGLGVLAAISVLAACGPQATQPRRTPSYSPTARVRTTPLPLESVPIDVAEQWRALGTDLVPPTGYLQNLDFKAEVVNHSGGKVDDATARRWAEALEREYQWDKWVGDNLQQGLLKKLGRLDAKTQAAVFGDDYANIHKARDAGGHLTVVFGSRSRFTLVPVSTELKDTLTQTYGYLAPLPDWAFLVDQAGSANVTLAYPDGRRETLSDLAPSYRDRILVAGSFQDYPGTLGPIWVLSTYLSCTSNDFLRGVCAT